jgi:hypothetical protein
VFLAGDAAHTASPTGGHGLNTGIGDVFGLAWMLDALVKGWGGMALLDAYGAERRPVATRNGGSSTRSFGNWLDTGETYAVLDDTPEGEEARARIGAHLDAAMFEEWNSVGIALGYRYDHSPVIIPDGSEPPPDEVSDYVPTARPGHRAPHAWLADGRSTLDLFGHGFALLAFGADLADIVRFEEAAAATATPLTVTSIDDPGIADLYGRRLVLVRPDGHVAWRADTAGFDPDGVLDTVCGRVAA